MDDTGSPTAVPPGSEDPALLRAFLESAPHGLMAVGADGRIAFLNNAMASTLGLRREHAEGADCRAVLPAPVARLVEARLEGGVPGRRTVAIEMAGRGRRLDFSIAPVRTGPGEAPSACAVACHDPDRPDGPDRPRELDTMKDNFLSLVSHELCTPLTSIVAYTETLLMDEDTPADTIREYLRTISAEGQKLTRLITDIIDLARMEAGRMDYNPNPLDCGELMGALAAALEAEFNRKRQTLDTQLAPGLPMVSADPQRLSQALEKILSNAVKFTPEGGRVLVRTSASAPDGRLGVPGVQIDIEDNGPGIPAEAQDQLFGKFGVAGRIDHHTSGTGLGLPIARNIIVNGHGGSVWLDSAPGRGTRVHVRVPALREG